MELLDRVVEDEERLAAVESRVEGGEEQEPESMDPKSEQWQEICLGQIGKPRPSPMRFKRWI